MLTSKLDIRVYNDRIATKNYVAIPEQRKITCFSGNVCLTRTRIQNGLYFSTLLSCSRKINPTDFDPRAI